MQAWDYVEPRSKESYFSHWHMNKGIVYRKQRDLFVMHILVFIDFIVIDVGVSARERELQKSSEE